MATAAEHTGLYNVESLYNQLRAHPDDVILTSRQAVAVWRLFRNHPIAEQQVAAFEHRAFLQAALMAAMEGSAAMGFVETLFRSAYHPNATVSGILKALAKEAFRQYYRKATLKNLKGLKLYTTVLSFIVYYNRPYFDMIDQGLDDL